MPSASARLNRDGVHRKLMLVSIPQLKELGVSKATIFRKLRSGKWKWEYGKRTGRGGGPPKLIHSESLPSELQLKLAHLAATDLVEEDIPQPEHAPVDEAPKLDLVTEMLKRFQLDERDAWIAELTRLSNLIERYSQINPKRIKNSNTNKHEFVAAVLDLCQEAACTDKIILSREPHRGQPPSPFTLYDWFRDYRKNGLLAFIRSNNQPIKNGLNAASRDRRRAEISPEAEEWINKFWRNYRHPRALYEAAKQKAKKQGWIIPAESWFYRRWKNLPKPVLSLHLHGEKDYLSKYAPYVPRTASNLTALQLLCGDHRRCDVGVVWRDGRRLIRPWLTLWQCVRTGLIWGWHLDETPSSYTIGMAYAGGVIQFGAQPPASSERHFQSFVYTDNGRDYRSHNFDGTITVHKKAARLDGGIELIRVQQDIGLYKDAQVAQYFARKGNAREKPVERTNLDFANWEETFDEWCGHDAKEKPETWVEMWHQHQKFLNGKRASTPFMSFDEYLEHLAGKIRDYNSSPHERTVLGGARIVPLEEYQRLYTTRYDISHESLALLLMRAEKRTIGKIGVGCSAAYKTWKYFNRAMAEFKGCEVEIRYDSNDLSRVWVILPNGQPCEAELVEKSGYLNPNKQTVSLMKRQEAFERKTFRDWNYINQSIVRGDTLEERVFAQYEIEPEETEAVAMEAGSPARVHQLTRMDKPKLRAVPRTRAITVDQVACVEADDSIFSAPESSKVSEFDFEE